MSNDSCSQKPAEVPKGLMPCHQIVDFESGFLSNSGIQVYSHSNATWHWTSMRMMSETGVTGVELFVKNKICLNSVIDTFGSLISTMSMTSNPTFTSSFKSEDGSLGTNTFLYVFSSLIMKLQVFSSLPSVQSSRSSHFLSRGIQPPFQHVNWSLGLHC